MTNKVITGLEVLFAEIAIQKKYSGNIGYLCHSASIDGNYQIGITGMMKVFGKRLKKIFSPQHGLVSDVQDNMIESSHQKHPFFKLPVYSLYSETRKPTVEMLKGLDHIFIDLQDVGTRIYTYIYTMTLMMEACIEKDIDIIVLDRPNPINGLTLEGNILEESFSSFVGLHPIPVRHGMTIGEIALMAQKHWGKKCKLEVIPMFGWQRYMSFEETRLPWVLPSPNLPTIDTAYTFVGTVIFEGTNISEGRGSTKSLEIVGHPEIEPYSFLEKVKEAIGKTPLDGFELRPIVFQPTFQKHQGNSCGGYQIHPTNRQLFEPWKLCQVLCQVFYHELGDDFIWKQPPYEYEYEKLPIDMINGTDKIRSWIEENEDYDQLLQIENHDQSTFINQRNDILLYR